MWRCQLSIQSFVEGGNFHFDLYTNNTNLSTSALAVPPKVTKEIEIYFERCRQRRIKDRVLNNLHTCENKDKCNIKTKEKVNHKWIYHPSQVSVCCRVGLWQAEEQRISIEKRRVATESGEYADYTKCGFCFHKFCFDIKCLLNYNKGVANILNMCVFCIKPGH